MDTPPTTVPSAVVPPPDVVVRVNTKVRGLIVGREYPVKMTAYVRNGIRAGHFSIVEPPAAPSEAAQDMEPVAEGNAPTEPPEDVSGDPVAPEG